MCMSKKLLTESDFEGLLGSLFESFLFIKLVSNLNEDCVITGGGILGVLKSPMAGKASCATLLSTIGFRIENNIIVSSLFYRGFKYYLKLDRTDLIL